MEPEGSLPHSQVPPPIPLLSKYISVWTFRNMIRLYGEELLALRPTPKPEDRPLSVVRDCLFNIFAPTLHLGGRSSHPQPEDAPCRDDRDPLITEDSLLSYMSSPYKLFRAKWRHSTSFKPYSYRYVSLLSCNLRLCLPKGSFSPGVPTTILYQLLLPHTQYVTAPLQT